MSSCVHCCSDDHSECWEPAVGFAMRSSWVTLLKAAAWNDGGRSLIGLSPREKWKEESCSHSDRQRSKGGGQKLVALIPLFPSSSLQPINHLRASSHQRESGATVPAWGPPGHLPRQPRGPRECPDRAAGGRTPGQPAGEGGAARGAKHGFG